jgi:hypothetical protein
MPVLTLTRTCCPACTQVEMKALDELIAQKLPRLSAHVTALEADVSILATDWFLTLYSASMPSETVSADATKHGPSTGCACQE